MTIPETLRQASEALQQASAALVATAQAMEDAPGPEPEPEPGEWRNDRAPKECEADDNLRVWAWRFGATWLVDYDLACFWYEKCPARNYWAPGNLPAPKSPPPDVVGSQRVEPQPDTSPEPGKSHTGGWIVDRQPTWEDADADGQVGIPGARQDALSLRAWTGFYFVHPGTPWCSPDDTPAPWDPTCLDRNGWIRSRLPGEGDADIDGDVLVPRSRYLRGLMKATHIVPGQPWAPRGSSTGEYQP